jgi:hypothetical protein
VGTDPATADAAFHFPNNYNYTYTTPTLNPGQMAVIEPIDAHTTADHNHPPTNDPINSVGSVKVTSSQPLAGVALEHQTMEDHATELKATRGFTDSDRATTLYAPINKNYRYDRFTGLLVQNAGQSSVNITVTYYYSQDSQCPSSGSVNDSKSNVAPGASVTFSSSAFPTGCFATAKIVATGGDHLIVAVVNEAFTGYYIATHPGHAQEATAYAAIPNGAATTKLSVPLFKEDARSKSTGLSVQNISATSTAHVVATFKNNTFTFVTNAMDIAPNQAIVLLDMRLIENNPPWWWHHWNGTAMTPELLGCVDDVNGCGANGNFSVILTSDQNIVAIANESTYPGLAPRINQDKSNYEAFNLTP